MDLGLAGRRALVTGSSSGIGEAIARVLADEGAHVVIHGRDRARCERVAAGISAAGIAIGDLGSDAGAADVAEQARAALAGDVEILVNNAGGNATPNAARPPLGTCSEDYLANIQVNLLAAVRLANLMVPAMVAAGWGRVIDVSSGVAIQPNNQGSDYSAAKAALNNFTVTLAGSLKRTGVTVNTVTPGIVMGEGMLRWGRARYGDDSLEADELTRRLADDRLIVLPPAGRLGRPEEVAAVVCMLASPRLDFVTGSNYRIDGGQIRGV